MDARDVKTIYLSGPMSGYENFNYDAFNAAAEAMRDGGYEVLNPAEWEADPGKSWHEYLRHDIQMILTSADAVMCLQDWENSEGAKAEVTVARAIGIPVWDISQFAPIENNVKRDDLWAKDHPEATEGSHDDPQRERCLSCGVWYLYPVELHHDESSCWANRNVQGNAYSNTYVGLSYASNTNTTGTTGAWTFLPNPEVREVHSDEPQTILAEADAAVDGPRQQAYDHPLDNFERIAALWSTILGVEVTEEQHALCMIAVKVARLMHSPDHRDSIVDIAGYARTIEKLQVERNRRNAELVSEVLTGALTAQQNYCPCDQSCACANF